MPYMDCLGVKTEKNVTIFLEFGGWNGEPTGIKV